MNHIENVSKIKSGCDYNLFRSDIKPMWEDQSNMNGGKWMLTINKQARQQCLDQYFIEMVRYPCQNIFTMFTKNSLVQGCPTRGPHCGPPNV